MAGFQERWLTGKTIKRVEAIEPWIRPRHYSQPQLRCVHKWDIYFTDGSRLRLFPNEDPAETLHVELSYYPAKRRK